MERRLLPAGIQTFREIREGGFYYVDKTGHVLRLVRGGKYYFLSRPRRFGKSLLVDTLKELFEGNGELFRGLAIHGEWDWSVSHSVLPIRFGSGEYGHPDGVREDMELQLAAMERRAMLEPVRAGVSLRFRELIRRLHERTRRRVVVLVDEYDKPILDALADPEVARANRNFLRSLYGVIKDCDADIRFCFLTGVSKFSKAGLFSGLNNLEDITLDPAYGTICGYTDTDLDTVFAPELDGLDRDEVRRWYNGYSWRGPERVYNPFDILRLFRTREFGNHWFETGTPTFLVETLLRRGASTVDLDGMAGRESLLSAFDVERISVEALLFQTGYLTITGEERRNGRPHYRLGYPNLEVRQSLGEVLLEALLPNEVREKAEDLPLRERMAADDLAGVGALFRGVFAAIPHQWYMNGPLAAYEGHYASVIHSCFLMQGFEPIGEDGGSRGRADMAVRFNGQVYLFEFKVVDNGPEGTALAQLRERGYADKYRELGRPVHLIGVEFSRRGAQHRRLLGRNGLTGGISGRPPHRRRGALLTPSVREPTLRGWKGACSPSAFRRWETSGRGTAITSIRRRTCCVLWRRAPITSCRARGASGRAF